MEKMTLGNGEEIKLEMFYRKMMEFEKKYPGSNVIKSVNEGGGTMSFTALAQLLYVGYTGGGNKTSYEFDEFVDLIPFVISDLMDVSAKLVSKRKN